MNVLVKVIKHPLIAIKYLEKYTKIGARRIIYNIRRQRNCDLHQIRLNKALKEAAANSTEELFEKWRREANCSFVPHNDEAIFKELSLDDAFLDSVVKQSAKVLNNSFYILYDYVEDCLKSNGHYRWFEDYKTRYVYKMSFYMDARKVNRNNGTDIKRIWEIARMQYLIAPALAYRLTGDKRYAEKVKDILTDFSELNPKYQGPNWNPAMEIGIRSANIVFALELISTASCVDGPFIQEMVGLLCDQMDAILENEENTSGKASNHYLGGILGLTSISSYLPFLRKSKDVAVYVYQAINHEIKTQILSDGGDYEGSTSYHRLVGELLAFSLLANRNSGFTYSKECLAKLFDMAVFTYNLSSARNEVVQFGDNDSGRVFQLLPEKPNDHRFMVNLISVICRKSVQDEMGREFLSILFGRELPIAQVIRKEKEWIASQFGIGRLSNSLFDLFVCCINAQQYGMGGHTHDDVGSFALNCCGFGVIVDPGTGNYTGNPELRNRMRSIDSHSAIKINDKEPRTNHSSGLFAWDNTFDLISLEKTDKGFCAVVKQNEILLRRNFVLKDNSVLIKDEIEGDLESATMKLVFAPDIEIEMLNQFNAKIIGPYGTLMLAGNWEITATESKYSPHYDNAITTKSLSLLSRLKHNRIEISFLKC